MIDLMTAPSNTRMLTKLVLIGGGGHGKACIDVIEPLGLYTIEGILELPERKGEIVLGLPIIGDDASIAEWVGMAEFLITVGQIKTAERRMNLYRQIKQAGGKLATIVAADAHVSRHSSLGEGVIVMHQALVNAASSVGVNTIINNKALIEHDCHIGAHCHISTGAIINGNCLLGDRVFIGSNATLIQGVTIADGVVIGAGAMVYRSIHKAGIYTGNPLKQVP
jgi:sugar O-acyltransferase (sialic acid O-acetyltransferase NeuD family)